MRNLLLLFTRFGHVLLFLIFQIICLFLIVNFNKTQKDIWANSVNVFSGGINEKIQNFSNYTHLKVLNDSLQQENARLRANIYNFQAYKEANLFSSFQGDSSLMQYTLIPVNLCSKTTHLRNNYFSLCQGKKDGLRKRMGIISEKGVLGIISKCTERFCKSIFIINAQSRINAQIRTKEYEGMVQWESSDQRELSMYSIPKFANVEVGDTIETSGHSTVFPEGVPIGVVTNVEILEGQNEYKVKLRMFEDVSKVENAYAIDYKYWEEKDSLVETGLNE